MISYLPIEKMELERINSPFGMRVHPITGKKTMHNGIDYPCVSGTPVLAVAAGKVVVAKMQQGGKGLGNYVTILHTDGTYSLYAHLKARHVYQGNIVKAGQIIGLSGSTGDSTGPHLHFGMCKKYNAASVNNSQWFDPMPYLEEAYEVISKVKMLNTDGEVVEVEAINKGGYNYVKVRDMEKLAPVKVDYNTKKKMPEIKAAK